MSAVGAAIVFTAKPGKGAEVARLIAAALPHVEAEAGTSPWLLLHSNAEPDTVFLVDRFTDAAARDAHMQGEAAKLIFATVPEHLADAPAIHPCDLLAFKP